MSADGPRGHCIAALAFLLGALAGCDEPCCRENADCVDGARCFEGSCALRCEGDAMCSEGEICSSAGVCREPNASVTLERCFGAVPEN
jgi:hypothetical protein